MFLTFESVGEILKCVTFQMCYKVVLTLAANQMVAIQQFFPVVPFIILYKARDCAVCRRNPMQNVVHNAYTSTTPFDPPLIP